uniref:Uncharacterized protein n=2 Tax=Chrysotila carterae TaxID=13221 RepID=A0A6S9ULF6_CHRCT
MPSDVIPKRPPGQRTVPERRTQEIPRASYEMDPASAPHFEHLLRHYSRQQSGASPSFSAGLSIFPSLLGLQLVTPPHHPEHEDAVLSAEQAQQIFLSRLLLLLGCFVILCLLLF